MCAALYASTEDVMPYEMSRKPVAGVSRAVRAGVSREVEDRGSK